MSNKSTDNKSEITKQMLLGDIAAVSSSSVKVKEVYKSRGVDRAGYRVALNNFELLDAFDEALNHARIEKMTRARDAKRKEEGKERMNRQAKAPREQPDILPGPKTLGEASRENGPIVVKKVEKKASPTITEKKTPSDPPAKGMFGMSSGTLILIGAAVVGAYFFYMNYKKKQVPVSVQTGLSGPLAPDPNTEEGREAILLKRWEGKL